MSVLLPFPVGEVERAEEPTSRTYCLDLEAGRIVGMVDGQEAVQQAIKKALLSPRFRCLIYDNQYGSEIKQTIIAGDATPSFVLSEIPRIVKDTLSVDSRILEVYDFEVELEGEEAYIRFTAKTIYGEIVIEEVI